MPQTTFDLQQAELLLPRLEQLLRAAMEARTRLTEFGRELARQMERIVLAGGCQVNVSGIARTKQQKDESAQRLQQIVEEIESTGCLLKDLDIGLVDFPCRVAAEEVYLCWKLGEPHIHFWHKTDEGFAGRKPIDKQMIGKIQRSCVH
jgi:hypothetical protein